MGEREGEREGRPVYEINFIFISISNSYQNYKTHNTRGAGQNNYTKVLSLCLVCSKWPGRADHRGAGCGVNKDKPHFRAVKPHLSVPFNF
jgi:hypothetical protein